MRSVYILLSRTNTVVSRIIRYITGDTFSHVSLSLDRSMERLYSFGRIYENTMLPGGFITENIHKGVFGKNRETKCMLYKLDINDDDYEQLELKIDLMLCNRSTYSYNVIGLILNPLNIGLKREHHFVCSQFVAEMVKDMLNLPKSPELMRPSDFCGLPQLEPIYIGRLSECDICDITNSGKLTAAAS